MSQAFSNNNNSFNTINYTTPDDESKVLAWLSPLEPWVRHRDIGAQRLDSVGAWLLETKEFRRWHNSGRGGEAKEATLFCEGNPGVGKSYIISLVIDKLCDEAVENDTAVTCFYFDFAARNEQSPINMLGSLLRQLVSGLEEIPEAVVQSFRNQRKVIGGRGLQVSGILKMFQTITATKRTFVCVDAIDECAPDHRIEVLESLGQILQGSPNTRILMTGRSHVRNEVERRLDGAAAYILIQPTGDGFVRYLREKLRNDTAPDTMSTTLEAAIMKSIPEISSETFLLASLHIDAVLQETTIARRVKRLKSLKDGAGLGDAYSATLERIKAQGGEKTRLAVATLTWICYAERPLEVDELCYALGVEIGAADFDPDNVPSIGAVLGYCQGLITVDKEASTVRLIHFTVQEYLCAQPDLFRKPHSTIAEACLTYLNSQQVRKPPPHPPLDHQTMPFLKYSSRYWGTHANKELTDHARTMALELLNHYEDHVSAVSLLEQVLDHTLVELIGNSPLFSGLHYASFFGSDEFVKTLINQSGCEINQRDCAGRTPFLWAAMNGHEGAARILLEQENIDPNHPDVHDETPLAWAAIKGHEGMVRLLLERENVDPNRPDKNGRTPLGSAAFEGFEGVVKLLLGRKDVDPDWPDNQDASPLCLAASKGHAGVLKLLIGRKYVDPDRPDMSGQTPLGCAALNGHEAVVKLLLEQENVDPNHSDMHNETPLAWAAIEGHKEVVKLLLGRKNVDPNLPDTKGRTPLGSAAFKGLEGVVKLLLGREDVDPDWPDNQDASPLCLAASKGHAGVVKLLIGRKDVDPDRPDMSGQTPLGCAALNGHEAVVKLLLEQENVDPNHSDMHNETPLAWAAIRGHKEVVKLLLERKNVDPNLPDTKGRTPLGSAAFKGLEGVVKLLLEREDVDPDWLDDQGASPLFLAASKGHAGVVKLLLDRKGVGPNFPGLGGLTPLGSAALGGHHTVVKLLLEQESVDPNHPDKDDRTPLTWAALNGHGQVVQLLLEQGDIDPDRPDKHGRTPLSDAASMGHEEVLKLLQARKSAKHRDVAPAYQL